MNTVDKIKAACKEQRIAVSKLERDLDFSNGYINSLRRGKVQFERLVKISDYLRVSPEKLIGDDEDELREIISNDAEKYYSNPETAKIAQEIFENKDLRLLFDASRNAKPEDLKLAHDMLMALKRKENGDID